jgi:hypothetical protein
MLVPGPGDNGAGALARLSVVLDGRFFGAAGAGIDGIAGPGTGSYSGEVTARVTSPFPEFDFYQDFNGQTRFALGGELEPVYQAFSSTLFLNYNVPFSLTVELDTKARKDRIALASSNFSSSLSANVQVVPEPTSPFLLLTGLLALAIIRFVSIPARRDSLRGHRRARADRLG